MTATVSDPTDESGWYYPSFVDPDRPEGDRWLGGCFVKADHSVNAAAAAWREHCNPGGEVHSAKVELRPIIHQHN